MILVLDANVLTADLAMRSPVYRVLARRIAEGEVQVVVPASALEEAAANWERALRERQAELKVWLKASGGSGFNPDVSTLQADLDRAAAGCMERLSGLLRNLGAETARYPSVSHSELVARAVQRRKPCDDQGNGYRDALVWHTVLELAAVETDEDIVLVTADAAFADRQGNLHQQLQAELDAARFRNVRLARRLDRFVVTEVLDLVPANDGDTKKLLREENRERMLDALTDALTDKLYKEEISVRDAGLPRGTREATLNYIEELADLRETRGDTLSDATQIIEFAVTVDAGIDLRIEVDSAEEHGLIVRDEQDDDIVRVRVAKKLIVEGLMSSDSHFADFELEVIGVRALPDDPGLWEWEPADSCIYGARG